MGPWVGGVEMAIFPVVLKNADQLRLVTAWVRSSGGRSEKGLAVVLALLHPVLPIFCLGELIKAVRVNTVLLTSLWFFTVRVVR